MLEEVPEEYRQAVINMADEAFPTRGRGRSKGELREQIALNWLAKGMAFRVESDAAGFGVAVAVPPNLAIHVLALTIHGSLIGFSVPEDDGQRVIIYDRIAEREKSTVQSRGRGQLTKWAMIGQRLCASIFTTSGVIALAAGRGDFEKTFEDMSQTAHSINVRTIL